MRKKLVRLKDLLFIPICIFFVSLFIFYKEIDNSFITSILMWISIGLGLLLIIGSILDYSGKSKKRVEKVVFHKKGILKFIYFYSEYVVNYIFGCYFLLYVILRLGDKSILYNYLLLLLFGLFLGYRLAVRAYYYLRKNNEKTYEY